ncbi:MAG: acetate--CoA ligase family protein [Desulfatiglandales bacterium]
MEISYNDIEALLFPRSVAVIGATNYFGKWGQLITSNIVAGNFRGPIYPVNPHKEYLFGLKCYKSILEVPDKVDLVFVTIPAQRVMEVLKECAQKGVRSVVMITSGFGETGKEGKRLQREMVEFLEREGILLVGPNTMGLISPYADLYATGPHTRPKKGNVAFVSQSGNLGNQLVFWATQQGIGISMFVGSGNEAMTTYRDFLSYLERDPRTRIIVLYLEEIGDGRDLLSTAKRVTQEKPILLLKGGRTKAGGKAAATHTGAVAGENRVFRGALRQAGIIDVSIPSELLELSAAFSSVPLPKGNRIGIVTLGGGWGVVTSDLCEEMGLLVPEIPEEIVRTIGRYLPDFWSKSNPVDLVGTRDPNAPLVAVEELLRWEGIDAVIVLGIVGRKEVVDLLVDSAKRIDPDTPPEFLKRVDDFAQNYEASFALRMVEFMEAYEKPVIGVSLTTSGEKIVREFEGKRYRGVFYQSPEQAVRSLKRMLEYKERRT